MPYKRRNTYYVNVSPAGYPHRVGPYSTRSRKKSVAQQMEATVRELAATGRHELLDALRDGEFTLPELHTAKVRGDLGELLETVEDPTLKKAVRDFLSAHDDSRYRIALDRVLDVAPEGARLSWLDAPDHVRQVVLRYRKEGLAPATEQREMAGVSLLLKERFGEARRTEIMGQVNLRRAKNGRTRWLTTKEIETLRTAADDWWVVIGTAIATGMRRGELLELRVRDVDLDAGAVVVQAGKSVRARRRIPLAGEPLALLRRWVASEGLDSDEFVFAEVDEYNLRYAWEQIREEADLEDVRFHDLRHTYAVHCAKAGMPLGELQQRLGHANIQMTMRYAVYQPPMESTHYRQALAGMGLSPDGGASELSDAEDTTSNVDSRAEEAA